MNKGKRPLKKIIHVNQHVIKRNRLTGENEPPLTVKIKGKSHPAHTVEILGPSRVVHSPHNPLSCGARVWIETHAEINLILDGETVEYESDDNEGWCAGGGAH